MSIHELPPPPPLPEAVLAENAAHTENSRESHILVARYRKARAISKQLLAHGATATAAVELGKLPLGRALAAKAANTNLPSETTWALVVELVREVRP